MILGMSTSTFTLVHVILSLVGIVAGFIVLFAMFSSKTLDGWTTLFLATTVLTSGTGFFFPSNHILPSHINRRHINDRTRGRDPRALRL